MAKNKGLGRGLDAIFDENTFSGDSSASVTTEISIFDIDPKANQPRNGCSRPNIENPTNVITATTSSPITRHNMKF